MRRWLLLSLALVAGLVFRIYGLSESLWLDEFSTLWCVEGGWKTISSRVVSFQGQTPFYYFVARASVDLFGESEVALRLPSLIASALTAGACGVAGHLIGGRPTALWAGLFAWLAFVQVQTGVNARPYAVAILGVALATAGFVGACRSKRIVWRAVFVAGACIAFWAHFVLALPVAGLAVGYFATPALRATYAPRAFVTDLLLIVAAAVPAWPYVSAAMHRPQHVRWLEHAQHSDALAILAPFALPWLLLATSTRQRDVDPIERALVASVICVVAGLELASLMGSNLVTARYISPVVVPAAVLAASAMPHLRKPERIIAAMVFLVLSFASYGRTWITTGTASGLGVEDWRKTTDEASHVATSATLILFRSGFVEEDMPPLGRPSPATLSPLRSPGTAALPGPVASLTHTWSASSRQEYFDNVLRPQVLGAESVIILAQRAVDEDGNYTDNVQRWCRTVYGDGMTVETLPSGRGIDLRLVRRARAKR